LEKNTIRFIDNFSQGTRGSASAEYFLAKSYAVIFLHRKNSYKPFERNFTSVDLFDLVKCNENDSFTINSKYAHSFQDQARKYESIKEKNLLLKLEFINLFEYFSNLKYICESLSVMESRAMVYLAAAVSDFYMPLSEMPEHKIQSKETDLVLNLRPVPKLLGMIKSSWCPKSFIVSFKLETDSNLLDKKCKKALSNYKHHVVIGNLLDSRKYNTFIMKNDGVRIDINIKNCDQQVQDIEELIIKHLSSLHSTFIEDNNN
jgi:phosphopantothenate---cysteine ligase (ATP)